MSSIGEGFFSTGALPKLVMHTFHLKEEVEVEKSWYVIPRNHCILLMIPQVR
jgi:hypothetical protein